MLSEGLRAGQAGPGQGAGTGGLARHGLPPVSTAGRTPTFELQAAPMFAPLCMCQAVYQAPQIGYDG